MTEEKYLENLGKIADDIEKMIRNYGRRKDIAWRWPILFLSPSFLSTVLSTHYPHSLVDIYYQL